MIITSRRPTSNLVLRHVASQDVSHVYPNTPDIQMSLPNNVLLLTITSGAINYVLAIVLETLDVDIEFRQISPEAELLVFRLQLP